MSILVGNALAVNVLGVKCSVRPPPVDSVKKCFIHSILHQTMSSTRSLCFSRLSVPSMRSKAGSKPRLTSTSKSSRRKWTPCGRPRRRRADAPQPTRFRRARHAVAVPGHPLRDRRAAARRAGPPHDGEPPGSAPGASDDRN